MTEAEARKPKSTPEQRAAWRERQQRRRDRLKAGKAVVAVEVDVDLLSDALAVAGLAPRDCDDPETLAENLEYLTELWARNITRDTAV